MVWLNPTQQKQSYAAAEKYLKSQFAPLGITKLTREMLTRLYRNPFKDNRTPDFVAATQKGVIYTGGTKLAQHGGFSQDDRNVTLLVANPAMKAKIFRQPVEKRQIAPTILAALGLNRRKLQAVVIEHTAELPGLNTHGKEYADPICRAGAASAVRRLPVRGDTLRHNRALSFEALVKSTRKLSQWKI